MVEYWGVLDEAHHLAVVRAALRAHGFSLPITASGDLTSLGRHFVDDVLPRHWPAYYSGPDYQRLCAADPRLCERLSLMGALGWRQVEALLPLLTSAGGGADTRPLGALFNTAISVIDYVVDERPAGAALFDLLNEGIVRAIFDLSQNVEAALGAACSGIADPHLRLLLALVGACAAEGRRLCGASCNLEAWSGLAGLIARLLEAERQSTVAAKDPSSFERQTLLDVMAAKSVLPSVAMLHIASLGHAGTAPQGAVSAAAVLGRAFWRMDDLADLLTDCQRGVPSALVIRLHDRVAAQGRRVAADADLYDIVDEAARELAWSLEPAAFMSGHDPPPAAEALRQVLAFAQACVGGWVGWRDDTPPPRRRRPAGAAAQGAAAGALEVLLAEQRQGFAEAVHALRLPRADQRYETHAALLSFRAVALDAMLDARDAGFALPEAVAHAEALAILRAKHRLVRGGWNYLPDVPELPPDADDNGQVLQVLARLGGRALAATCEEPIRMHLDTTQPDGGVLTWVVDPCGNTPADAAVRGYLCVMGGWGVHPEVVANLGYGLILYDFARFYGPLQRIAGYLEGIQQRDGSWSSMWYHGPFYGTFRAASVLAEVRRDSPSINHARAFLLGCQRHDGGWGELESQPLSTALALLALDELGAANHAAFSLGVGYLTATRHPTDGWKASPWIRFRTVDGEVVYGSRTVTTAFCLKALVATA